jgi:polyphosphate kinase
MSKHSDSDDHEDAHYKRALYDLQVELVKLQRHLIETDARVLVIIEGRDGAGKDGTIKRLTEHMSPRETRVHAPAKPSSREDSLWYFQRFVRYLPAAQEFVIFNRSWYNRAGVEPVMGFCKPKDVEEFFESVVPFETMLVRDSIAIRKYYLDISKKEQKKRLAARHKDPLKQWKSSPVDEAAIKNWDAYTKARDDMFQRSDHLAAPWNVVHADVKKLARLELIRDLLHGFDYKGKTKKLARPDSSIVFPWSEAKAGMIAS